MLLQAEKTRATKLHHRRQKLNGPDGLLLAVIAVATTDALSANEAWRRSALVYFQSSEYRHHLGLLDLPPDWFPQGVTTVNGNGR